MAVTSPAGTSRSAHASNAAAIASCVALSATIIASTTSWGICGPGRPRTADASAIAAESDAFCSSTSSATGTSAAIARPARVRYAIPPASTSARARPTTPPGSPAGSSCACPTLTSPRYLTYRCGWVLWSRGPQPSCRSTLICSTRAPPGPTITPAGVTAVARVNRVFEYREGGDEKRREAAGERGHRYGPCRAVGGRDSGERGEATRVGAVALSPVGGVSGGGGGVGAAAGTGGDGGGTGGPARSGQVGRRAMRNLRGTSE